MCDIWYILYISVSSKILFLQYKRKLYNTSFKLTYLLQYFCISMRLLNFLSFTLWHFILSVPLHRPSYSSPLRLILTSIHEPFLFSSTGARLSLTSTAFNLMYICISITEEYSVGGWKRVEKTGRKKYSILSTRGPRQKILVRCVPAAIFSDD